jgi:ataxin-3
MRSFIRLIIHINKGNVDSSGNFSFEVLRCALQRSFDINLISWTGSEGRNHQDPTVEKGFILNRNHHWFTIRRIGENWWNLDSTLEYPEHISPFYLSAYLSQLREDGFSVFIVDGELPEAGVYNYDDNEIGVIWYREADLLTKKKDKNKSWNRMNYDEEDEELLLAKALSASMHNS